jgi:hypothetical protein
MWLCQMRISHRQAVLVATLGCASSLAYHGQEWAFIARRSVHSTGIVTRPFLDLHMTADRDNDEGFDLEATREKLEALMGDSDDDQRKIRDETRTAAKSPAGRSNQSLYASLSLTPVREAPLLTSIERERRQAEIKVLQRLERSDDALADLWTLWFHERGAESASRLTLAEELASHPKTWKQAEAEYRDLIATHGVHWAEPVNKLATLYFLQGRLQESAALCKIVIAVKPWHFGALSGIVAVYIGLQDMDKARHWAASRLPMLGPPGAPNKRREEWVEKAVGEAKQALVAAEQQLKLSFGKQDPEGTEGGNQYCNELDDTESWQ